MSASEAAPKNDAKSLPVSEDLRSLYEKVEEYKDVVDIIPTLMASGEEWEKYIEDALVFFFKTWDFQIVSFPKRLAMTIFRSKEKRYREQMAENVITESLKLMFDPMLMFDPEMPNPLQFKELKKSIHRFAGDSEFFNSAEILRFYDTFRQMLISGPIKDMCYKKGFEAAVYIRDIQMKINQYRGEYYKLLKKKEKEKEKSDEELGVI